ncbi:MAG: hypothetical protein R2761_16095 [Acidimicrobiales bacterium]
MSTDLSTDLPAGQRGRRLGLASAGVAEDAPTDAAVGRGTPADDLDQHRDRHLEAILNDHQVAAVLTWCDVDDIDWDSTAANQIRTDTVDPDTVDRYIAALEAGAVFPAGLATSTPTGGVWIVAGVHRARAYAEGGYSEYPTYWATGADSQALWLVSVASNVGHGLPLSYDEQIEQALRMLDAGLTQADASARTGLPLGRIRAAVSARRSGELLAARGMARSWEKLPRSGQWRLGMAAAGDVEVLAEAVATATSLGLTHAGLIDLAGAITRARRTALPGPQPQREAAILAVEDFEELHRPERPAARPAPWRGGGGTRSRSSTSASPVHALRDRCRDVLDVDADEAIDSCPPGDALITADLLRRTAARLATTADRIAAKAGHR